MPPTAQPRRADHRPYFYLSYAHTPRGEADGRDPDMWVERLYRDLCGHVMAMTDLPAGAPAGFMDREIRSGEGWSERLGEVLATCRVFVPLFSPRYFASEMCGKEWHAFEQRAIRHRASTDQPAEAIVPALWFRSRQPNSPNPQRGYGSTTVTSGTATSPTGCTGSSNSAFSRRSTSGRSTSSPSVSSASPTPPGSLRGLLTTTARCPAPSERGARTLARSMSRWRRRPCTTCRRAGIPPTTAAAPSTGTPTTRPP
ncbi:TIR-like protein FxsC [Streptomyces rubiginosohelvolus]|uniref:TIR-like protein FxsC n=1 Tax=Streptomyces rubiginosohelvolus TaxID=67362 RepID=UPI0037FB361E